METLPEYDPLMSVDENGDVVVPDVPDKLGWTVEERDAHDGLGAFGVTAAAAAERMIADEEPGKAEKTPAKLSVGERLEKIEKRFHFVPQSRDELNDAIGLTDKDYVGGAATRLNIILNHQMHLEGKEENLPRRTIEQFITRYLGFAENSQHQVRAYRNLQNMIAVEPQEQYLQAETISILRDWDNDASTRAPVLRLARVEALQAHIAAKGETPDPFAIEKGAGADRAVKQRGAEYVASHRVIDILHDIEKAIDEQHHRFNFWVDTLTETTRHDAAASSAIAALKKLGVITSNQ